MSYGAEFKNNLGEIVISDERLAHVFIGKASFTGTVPNRMGHVHRFYIASSKRPIVFAYGAGKAVSVLAIVQSGSGFLIDIASTGDQSGVSVYCFAQVALPGYNSGYGMNIYDAYGNIVFSSNWKLLNVRGIVVPGGYGATVQHGVSGLVKPAAMCPCNSGQSSILTSGTSYVEWDDRDVFLLSGTSITTQRTRLHYWDDSYWGVGSPPYNYGNSADIVNVQAKPFPIIDAAQYD